MSKRRLFNFNLIKHFYPNVFSGNCGNEFCYRPLNVMTESRTKLLFPHSIADDILIMIAQTCFFHIILILFEIKNRRKWHSSNLQKDIIIPTDVDVIAEKNFIDKLIKDYQDNVPLPSEIAVIVKGLSKKYGKKKVLREVNFRVSNNNFIYHVFLFQINIIINYKLFADK